MKDVKIFYHRKLLVLVTLVRYSKKYILYIEMGTPILVNFISAPSIGKSTMSSLAFVRLKTDHNKAELVQEYAKQLVWGEKFDVLSNQWYVSKKQYKMLKAVYGKVDYLVTDSPLLLGGYYNRYYPDNVCDREKTEEMILEKIKEFNNIYIFLKKNSDFPFEKEGRIHTEEQSIKIEQQLKEMLDEFKIDYLEITSDVNNMDKIIDYIYKKSGKL